MLAFHTCFCSTFNLYQTNKRNFNVVAAVLLRWPRSTARAPFILETLGIRCASERRKDICLIKNRCIQALLNVTHSPPYMPATFVWPVCTQRSTFTWVPCCEVSKQDPPCARSAEAIVVGGSFEDIRFLTPSIFPALKMDAHHGFVIASPSNFRNPNLFCLCFSWFVAPDRSQE